MKFEYDLGAFGNRLKAIMDEKKLTARRLGAVIQADFQTVNTWITGKHYPNGYYVVRLCMALDVSADYLLFGK